jgi:hypothetical protein
MILVHGFYRFKPKRVAFRNDFCLACAKAVRAFQVRTFDVLHVFWIPLLPVWHRPKCGIRRVAEVGA